MDSTETFCTKCGQQTSSKPSIVPKPKSHKKFIFIIIILLIIAGISSIIVFSNNDNPKTLIVGKWNAYDNTTGKVESPVNTFEFKKNGRLIGTSDGSTQSATYKMIKLSKHKATLTVIDTDGGSPNISTLEFINDDKFKITNIATESSVIYFKRVK